MTREIVGQSDVEALAEQWAVPVESTDSAGPPRIRSIAEITSFRTYAAQNIDWIVDGIIAAGTVTLMSGESGSGKSTVTSAICSAVERGAPFAGLVTQRRPVLILDRENPLPIVVDRFNRLGIDDSPNFRYWGGWLPEEAPSPNSPIISEWVRDCESKPLIVVDSLVGFNAGDENSASETRAYMQGFRRLADKGATVIVLHHSGKADTARDYRGSSDIKASIDIGYHLANLGDPSKLDTLRLRPFKSRFSVQEIILRYEGGQFRRDVRAPSVSVADALRDLLIANPRVGVQQFEELASQKDIARSRSRKFLADRIAQKTISVEKLPRNGRAHTWVGSMQLPRMQSADC
jgi:RecA-family ATPase